MYKIYQVMMGDTIDNIASRFNTDTNTLLKINGNMDLVPGSIVVVPKNNSYLMDYIVKEGDTIYSIGRKNNVSADVLLTLNGLNEYDYIYPNQSILVPMDNVGIYVTKDGDTLSYVLNNLGINADKLLNDNEKIFLLPDQLIVYKKEKSF